MARAFSSSAVTISSSSQDSVIPTSFVKPNNVPTSDFVSLATHVGFGTLSTASGFAAAPKMTTELPSVPNKATELMTSEAQLKTTPGPISVPSKITDLITSQAQIEI